MKKEIKIKKSFWATMLVFLLFVATFAFVWAFPNNKESQNIETQIVLAEDDAEVTDAPAPVNDLVFDGTAQELITAGTANNGTMKYKIGVDGEYSTELPTATNAGTYTIYYKAVGDEGYNDSAENNFNVTIDKKDVTVTVTANNQQTTYTGNLAVVTNGYTLSCAGLEGDDTVGVFTVTGTVEYAYNVANPTNADSYTITPSGVTAITSDNYNVTSYGYTAGTLTIGKAPLTVTANNATITYGDAAPALNSYTANCVGFVNNEDESVLGGTLAFACTYTQNDNATTYAITPSGLTSSNYELNFVDGTLTVNNAELTNVSISQNGTLTYNGNLQDVNVSKSATAVNNQALTYKYCLTQDGEYTTLLQLKYAGTHTVYYKVSAPNHNDATGTFTVTVNKAEVAAPEDAQNTFDYTGSEHTYLPENWDDIEDLAEITNNTRTDAGTQTVTISLKNIDNYCWDDDETTYDKEVTITVTPATLTNVSITQSGTLTYNGTEQPVLVNHSATAVNSQTVTFTYSTTQDGTYTELLQLTDAGEYTVYYKASAANHNDATGTFTVTVNKAEVVEPEDAQNTFDYTGSEHTYLPENWDDIKVLANISNNTRTDAGSQTVIISLKDTNNYCWEDDETSDNKEVTLTVNNATLTNVSVAQNGAFTYTGAELTANVTTSATAVNNQTVTFTYSTTQDGEYGEMPAFTAAGEHTVYYKATAPNHNEASGSFVITIGKATYDMTGVTFANAEYTYDGNTKSLAVSGDLPSGVTVAYTGNEQLNASATAYTVTAVFTGNANYNEIPNMTAYLTINFAELTNVSVVRDGSYTYNGQPQVVAVTTSATAVNNQEVTFTYSTTEVGEYGAMPAFTAAGEHTVYYKATAPNHNEASGSFVITIGKATYDMTGVTFANAEYTYDGSAKSLAVSGDLPTGVTVAYTGNEQVNASATAYTVTAVFTGNANYNEIPNMTAYLTINFAELTNVSVVRDGSYTYNGQPQVVAVTTSATAVNNQEVTFTYSITQDGEYGEMPAFTNAGNHIVYYKATAPNHNEASGTVNAYISKADSVLVTAPTYIDNLTYTGEAQALVIAGEATGGTIWYTLDLENYSIEVPVGINVKRYYVCYKVVGDENHNDIGKQYIDDFVIIQPAQLTNVSVAQSGTLTYTGAELTVNVTTSATAVNNQEVTFTYSTTQDGEYDEMPAFTAAGEHTVYYKATASNHSEATGSFVVTIGKATYDMTGVTFANAEYTYDGNAKSLAVSGELPTGVTVAYTGNEQVNASATAYTVTAVFTGNENYNEIPNMTAYLTINFATLTNVSVAQSGTLTYNGNPQNVLVNHSAIAVNSQTVTFTYSTTQDGTYTELLQLTGAGEYTVYYKASAANHNDSAGTFTVTVNKAKVELPEENDTVFTYTGNEQTYLLANWDVISEFVNVSNNIRTVAGSQQVTISLRDTDNYCWEDDETSASKEVTFTVNNATLTNVSVAQNGTLTYTGAELTANVTTNATAVNNQAVTFTYSTTELGEYGVMPAFTAAGEHTVYYKATAPNHNEASGSFVVTIGKATYDMTGVTFANAEYTYDGSAKSLAVSGDLPTGVTVAYTGNEQVNANATAYTVTAVFTGNENYNEIPNMTAYLTINFAELTNVNVVQDGALTYTGAELTASVTTNATAVNNQTVTFTYSTTEVGEYGSMPAFVAAGEHTVYYKVTAPNHNVVNGSFVVTIGKATYDMTGVTFANAEYTYDGNAKSLAVSGELPTGVTVAYTGNEQVNASATAYTVTAVFTGNENYNEIPNMTAYLTINFAELTNVSVAQDGALTYTGAEQIAIVTTNATAVNNQAVTFTYSAEQNGTYTNTVPAFAAVGEHTVYYKATAPNHNEASGSFVVTIGKIKVALPTESTAVFTFNGSEQTYLPANWNDISDLVNISNNTRTNAGEQQVTISLKDTNGYCWNDTNNTIENKTLTFSIGTYEVTIAWVENNFTYNGEEQVVTATYKDIDNQDIALKVTMDRQFKNFGEYTATASFATGDNTLGNYKLPTIVTNTYNVKVYEVTIVWVENDFTYNGEEQVVTATYKDIDNQDVALKVTMDRQFKNFGEYTATASFATGDNTLGNYKLPTVVTNTYNVKAYEVAIVWVENNFVYNGEEQIVAASYVGFDSENPIALEVSMNKQFKDVANDYVAAASFAVEDNTLGNYKLPANVTNDYAIKALEITIDWQEDDFTYNGLLQTITASYVLNDGGDAIPLNVQVVGQFKNSGVYTAVASFVDTDDAHDNYKLPDNATKTYTIKRAPLNVVVNDAAFTLGETVPAYTFTVTGFVNGENYTQQIKNNSRYVVDGSLERAGICKIKLLCSETLLDNYIINTVAGEYTIDQKELNDNENGVSVVIAGDDEQTFGHNVSVVVEAKAEVGEEEAKQYSESLLEYVGSNKIVSSYDVKLVQSTMVDGQIVEVEIQPSDIKEGARVTIKMAIPKVVANKSFKVLHIHSESDFEYVDYKIDGDSVYVTTNRLSQFAFVDMTNSVRHYWSLAILIIDCALLLLVILGSVYIVTNNKRLMYILIALNATLTVLLILTIIFINLATTIVFGSILVLVLTAIMFVVNSLNRIAMQDNEELFKAEYDLVENKKIIRTGKKIHR